MKFTLATTLAVLAATAAAVPAPAHHVVHEKRTLMPRNWVKRAKLASHHKMPMRIGLTQSNLDKGHDLLMELSSHESPNYSDWLSEDEVNELFAPAKDTVDAVRGWLEEAGIAAHRVSQSFNKQWLQFDASVKEAEDLLLTKYHAYEHKDTGKINFACDKYHVPAHVQKHVDYVTPGIKLFTTPGNSEARRELEKRTTGVTSPNPKKPHSPEPPLMGDSPVSKAELGELAANASLALCGAVITPDCVRALYNITKPTTAAKGNELGIFESIGDVYAQEDLNSFFETLAPQIPNGTHPTLDSVDGATAPDPVAIAGPESDLDFQLAYPIIYPQQTVLYQVDDDVYQAEEANGTAPFQGFFNTFLDAIDGSYCSYSAFGEKGNDPTLDPVYPDPQPGGFKGQLECGKYKPTNVISISYGGQEFDLPAYYQKRQCNEFMKLGLRGVSIVVASGDSGVAGPAGDDNPDGCLGPNGTIFSPDFPATCPYITSAGGTVLPAGGDVTKDQETAVTRFPSGGGFSNIYAIPSYQAKAVSTYFKTANPPYPFYSSTNNNSFGANGGIYNRNGRGYPDVSAVGDRVIIFNRGIPRLIGGTSASTPVFASVLTRINELRLAKGKKTVGFVNPILYANPGAFNDITVGNNSGCGTPGFFAAKGWDPLTGLGTPNYPKLADVFLALP